MVLHKTISSIPSEAIYQALDDLRQIAVTPGYSINMGTWYYTDPQGTCSVCLGGAVMAALLQTHPEYHHSLADNVFSLIPADFKEAGLLTEKQVAIIFAMDRIREPEYGAIVIGLRTMGVPRELAEAVVDEENYTIYDDDPEKFIRERAMIAEMLKQRGY